MPALPRQKACIACAESKRRCDKQLPECQRCLDRDVDCLYPQPKKRRRETAARDSQIYSLHHGLPTTIPDDPDPDPSGLGHDLGFGEWGPVGGGAPELDVDVPNLPGMLHLCSAPPPPPPNAAASGADVDAAASAHDLALDNGCTPGSTSCPWFLRDETWTMQHKHPERACTFALEPFIRTVTEMMESWVRSGHNAFIHPRLYAAGMPACIQDAFTTLAAYVGATPAVKETVLHIAEERACALARQAGREAVEDGGATGIRAHLARVQALFVYQFIRLFDGSVPLRACAEQQIPTLRRWVMLMWEAVRRYRGEDSYLRHRPLEWAASEFEREYDASSELWRLWILTESVRRTHIIIETIINVYQAMTTGWAECHGAVKFTARRGCGETESAVKWLELSCEKPPLLVSPLDPDPLMARYPADEFEDFVKVFWGYIVGTDKIQCWVDRSEKARRT